MVWLIGGIIIIAAVFALLWRTSAPSTPSPQSVDPVEPTDA